MTLRTTKIAIFLAALIPLERLAWKAFHAGLGANPIEFITHSTGDWTLILILTTLSITPLRRITRQYWLIGVRRMIGLFAFFYGCLHFTTYIWLDKSFDVHEMLKDIAKRPFITIGFSAFVLMIPLDPPGPDFDCMVDSPPRRQELAASAPANLFDRNPGRSALRLAGEGRPPQAPGVRRGALHPAAIPHRSLDIRKAWSDGRLARPEECR